MQPSGLFRRFLRGGPVPIVVLAALLVACAPAAPPTPTPAPPKPAPTAAPAKPAPTTAPAKPAPTTAPAAAPAAKPVALPKPELTSIKIGFSALEPPAFTARFAEDLGLYKKYGIEKTETFYFDGASKALQAMVAGQVDFNSQSGGPVISSLTTGVPLVLVAMHTNKLADHFVSLSSVKTAADLKGKRVAISQFGGLSHVEVLLALKALGLTPNDVNIVQIGGESARLAALAAGTVAASPLEGGREEELKKQGFNILLRLSESKMELPQNGIYLRRDWLTKNPNTILAVAAANLEAQQLWFSQTEQAIDLFAKWTQSKDRGSVAKRIKEYLPIAQRDLRWKPEAWENQREVMVTVDPKLKDVDLTKAYTYEFVDKLKQMGLYDAVGVPKS